MGLRVIRGLKELKSLVGSHLGTGEWVEISQDHISAFARAVEDPRWNHGNLEPDAAESCRSGVPDFLVLSLGPALASRIFSIAGVKLSLNYGLGHVRFSSPVKVGSRLRLRIDLNDLKEVLGGAQAVYKMTFEVDGAAEPACVSENIVRHYFEGEAFHVPAGDFTSHGVSSVMSVGD